MDTTKALDMLVTETLALLARELGTRDAKIRELELELVNLTAVVDALIENAKQTGANLRRVA